MNIFRVIIISIFALCLLHCSFKEIKQNKLIINSFVEGSNLEAAGAKQGDVILKYNGKTVLSQEHLGALKRDVENKKITMVLLRNGNKINVKVPIGQLGATLKEFVPDHIPSKEAVIIEDIGKLDWGIGMENSFLACVYLLEQKFGKNLSYIDLLGISGYGFKLMFFDRFCPSSPDATVGFDSGHYLLNKLGYTTRYYHLVEESVYDASIDYKTENELRSIILKSIDLGWPIIAIDLIQTPEWGLITGYQNEGAELFCRTFFDKTEGYEIAQKFPSTILVIEKKRETNIKPYFKESLQLAQELYETPSYQNYFSGITALEEWIKALQDEQYFLDNKANIADVSHANWWIFVSMQLARGLCSKYLLENIENFTSDPKVITKLAEIYQNESDLLVDNYDAVPNEVGQHQQSWTPELRSKQLVIMQQLLKLEEEALKILKKI